MVLSLAESLPALVARRFTSAKESGHLVFSQTQLTTIHASGIPYQLRYCPALAKKQSEAPKPNERKGPKPDPFQDPPPDLTLVEIPKNKPTHFLVLNKFPVIPNHFILATKPFKEQTDILEKEDLEVTYACLKAWSEDAPQGYALASQRRLFAFFNSGEYSGASQPHRHLQFLPVEAMRGSESDPWTPLIDRFSTTGDAVTDSSGFQQLPQLPFVHFALPIPPNASAETLHQIYLSLYKAAVTAVNNAASESARDHLPLTTEGPAAISYNLAMTVSTMMICPRRSEHAQLTIDPAGAQDVVQAGLLSLNGTILAGTLMVKAEAEWNELRSKQANLNSVLATIAFPRQDGATPAL